MDNRSITIRHFAGNPHGAEMAASYGIEVEVEGLAPEHRPGIARGLSRYWAIKEDGSLRNNGAEFVSKVLAPEHVAPAIASLYRNTRPLWTPSPRTGIHIHANCLMLSVREVRNICTAYAMVEPLLFHFAGAEREENIFCVPWYRAQDEAELISRALKNANVYGTASCCKYSALFLGPLRTFGTIEFRHARTFDTSEELQTWANVVGNVYAQRGLDAFALYGERGPAAVARVVLGDYYMDAVQGMNDDQVEALLHDTGAIETAFIFEDYTYNPSTEWGSPGSFVSPDITPPISGERENSSMERGTIMFATANPAPMPSFLQDLGYDEEEAEESEVEEEQGYEAYDELSAQEEV